MAEPTDWAFDPTILEGAYSQDACSTMYALGEAKAKDPTVEHSDQQVTYSDAERQLVLESLQQSGIQVDPANFERYWACAKAGFRGEPVPTFGSGGENVTVREESKTNEALIIGVGLLLLFAGGTAMVLAGRKR
jgi:hypothetical protein